MADSTDGEYTGATPNQVLFHAIQAGNVDLLQEVLQGGSASGGRKPDLESTNSIGDTPVLASLRAGQLDVLGILLEEEVDVDEGNQARDGDRPLHLAVRLDDVEQRHWAVEQLLEAGSDARLANKEGFKPADILTANEENEPTRKLLRNAEATSGMSRSDFVGKYIQSLVNPWPLIATLELCNR